MGGLRGLTGLPLQEDHFICLTGGDHGRSSREHGDANAEQMRASEEGTRERRTLCPRTE